MSRVSWLRWDTWRRGQVWEHGRPAGSPFSLGPELRAVGGRAGHWQGPLLGGRSGVAGEWLGTISPPSEQPWAGGRSGLAGLSVCTGGANCSHQGLGGTPVTREPQMLRFQQEPGMYLGTRSLAVLQHLCLPPFLAPGCALGEKAALGQESRIPESP